LSGAKEPKADLACNILMIARVATVLGPPEALLGNQLMINRTQRGVDSWHLRRFGVTIEAADSGAGETTGRVRLNANF